MIKKILVLAAALFTGLAHASLNITEQEVTETQQRWGAGIVHIGQTFLNGGDYVQAAADHINAMYDYEKGYVLFKPTLASAIPFRPDFEGALSYFVGKNPNFPEDTGFAIKPWTNVRFENHRILLYGIKAIAMGHYYFTTLEGNEVKVEYTLGFIKRDDGIRINLQDSSLPYTP